MVAESTEHMLAKMPPLFLGRALQGHFCLLLFFPLLIFFSFQDITEGIVAGNYLCLSVDCAVKRPVGLRAEDLYPRPGRLKGSGSTSKASTELLDLLLDLDLEAHALPVRAR